MSEAGLLVAKPERQWRPGKRGPKRKRGAAANGTYRWKAPWIQKADGVGAPCVERILVLRGETG
jgi:hypothetical protein